VGVSENMNRTAFTWDRLALVKSVNGIRTVEGLSANHRQLPTHSVFRPDLLTADICSKIQQNQSVYHQSK
jgi:hypothetical protein